MNSKDYFALMDETNIARKNLSQGKTHDYATDDVLSNFKRMNKMCQILNIDPRRSPGDNARYLALLKLDRWCNLANKKDVPQCEKLNDTKLDLHNYIDLGFACEIDEQIKFEAKE